MEERFFSKVNKTDTCWLWTGCNDGTGYGLIKVNKKMEKAHRISWSIAGNTIPNDRPILRHKCRNRHCVNPEHLETGTLKDNSADRGEKCYKAKLTAKQVLHIRERTHEVQIQLAREFNVSETTIYDIIHRRSWKHI